MPILPIRNIVVFPGTVMPLNVGRQKSKNLLDEVMPAEKLIGVVTQKNAEMEDPGYGDLFTVGTACMILKLFKLPDGNQIDHRAWAGRGFGCWGSNRASRSPGANRDAGGRGPAGHGVGGAGGIGAAAGQSRHRACRPIRPTRRHRCSTASPTPSALADFLAANLPVEKDDIAKNSGCSMRLDVEKRLRIIAARLATQLDVLELQNKIQSQVKENIDKSQRRYYLQEQLKAIRKELGEGDSGAGGSGDGTAAGKTGAPPRFPRR